MKKTLLSVLLPIATLAPSLSYAADGDGPAPISVNGGIVQFSGSIVNSPCSISTGSANQTVELGQYRASDFVELGDVSATKDFNITLKDCSAEAYTKVAVKFNGDTANGSKDKLAVNGGAQGVAIQIVKDGKPISVNNTDATDPINLVEGADNNIYFQAQYVSIAKEVKAGAANAVADFYLNYN